MNGFSERLKQALARKGLTRADLSRELRLSYSSVDRWFKGSIPHRRTLPDLSKVLGVAIPWLERGVPPMLPLDADQQAEFEELQSAIPEPTPTDMIIGRTMAAGERSAAASMSDNELLLHIEREIREIAECPDGTHRTFLAWSLGAILLELRFRLEASHKTT